MVVEIIYYYFGFIKNGTLEEPLPSTPSLSAFWLLGMMGSVIFFYGINILLFKNEREREREWYCTSDSILMLVNSECETVID